jgi:hypothetical protein
MAAGRIFPAPPGGRGDGEHGGVEELIDPPDTVERVLSHLLEGPTDVLMG